MTKYNTFRILYTTHQFFPDFGAGTELLTYSTAQEISRKGHDVHIVTGYPSKTPVRFTEAFDFYRFKGFPVYRYRHSSFHPCQDQCIMEAEHHNKLVKSWFAKIIEKVKPDIVHAFHLQRLSGSVLEVCHEWGIPVVFTITDFWAVCPTTQLLLPNNELCIGPKKKMENCIKHLSIKSSHSINCIVNRFFSDGLLRMFVRLLENFPQLRKGQLKNVYALSKRQNYLLEQINRVKCIFVTNQFMSDLLKRYGVDGDLIVKLPFGIAPLEHGIKKSKEKAHSIRVGFIGTLNYHKGAHVVIKALRSLPKSISVQLKIYGNRNQFPEYVSMLDSISSDDSRIKFVGTFPPDSIGQILSELDILVVPSLWYENTPLIMHQAQAAKLPIIASDLGGMNEMIEDQKNGFLIPPGQYEKLSEILKSLAENPKRIDAMRRDILSPIFIDQYVDVLEKQYANIVTTRKKLIHAN